MDTLTDPVFRSDGTAFIPGDAAVGPWSADALQGSATAALAVRMIETHPSAEGRQVARLGFDFWRPAGRAPIELAFSAQAASAADLVAGISQLAHPSKLGFVNADLTINLFRPPAGDWVLLDARTLPGPHGTGYATGSLHDRDGAFGQCSSSLLFEARA